ncbi:hypothetical protein [Streptomyces sp. NRRL S-350]|uniref:hypothetical protein n=1 Tax=Streptomyces sp. NRRL S-350 TaxID=1463902 RepID=UPI0004BFCF74|nr:hypothetical protein [Streptomyces sp. NRRL S-350]
MSEPSDTPQPPSRPTGSADGTSPGSTVPRSLLDQMQELLASVTADLAELQSSGARDADAASYPTGTDTSEASAAPGIR